MGTRITNPGEPVSRVSRDTVAKMSTKLSGRAAKYW